MCAFLKTVKKRQFITKIKLELAHPMQVCWLKTSATNHDVFSSIIHIKEGSYLTFSTWMGAQHDSQQHALSIITLVISGQTLVNLI